MALRPRDEAALRALIEIYTTQDRTLEVLEALRAIRLSRGNPDSLLSEIQERAMPAIGKFNAHLEAGETVQAERYAAALVALIPNSEPMLTAAMSCNQVLRRWGEVERYARALLKVDPTNPTAQVVMAAANRTAPPRRPPIRPWRRSPTRWLRPWRRRHAPAAASARHPRRGQPDPLPAADAPERGADRGHAGRGRRPAGGGGSGVRMGGLV
uniref:Uncharacterized protein n=1 Tax=Phenylobacterium glaciei TaxID=2803784 RepID=A0A974S8L3_9CAUL|nr:hypothetical protein JKL49_14050 [Phenylobacterium glaciei]